MQTFMLRETVVKDICVDLAQRGIISNTWERNVSASPTAITSLLSHARGASFQLSR